MLNEAKQQYLIIKRKNNCLKNLKDPQVFIEFSYKIQFVYKKIEEYNPSRKCNVIIAFNYMVV